MKVLKKILKIIGISLGGLVALVLVVILGLNVAKFAIYHEYYSIESRVGPNPGLNEGAVPQGIATSDAHPEFVLTTAYMADKSNSRIYVVYNDRVDYVKLVRNGEKFTSHVGGIGLDENHIYIANSSKIYKIPVTDLFDALNGDKTLDVGTPTTINNKASFCSVEGDYLYVGEYCDGKEYKTDTSISHDGVTYNAIISKYLTSDLSKPVEMYAIRNNVQGTTVNPNGDIYISTSCGLNSSHFYKYSKDILTNPISYEDNLGYTAPLYVLGINAHERDIMGPAMAEDLSYRDGKVLTLSESASNKYIFGKFFFAYDIIALNF